MAEVQNLATSDIPIGNTSAENLAAADAAVVVDAANAADLGTSPTQERSSNSHPHDSEYDTASDLEDTSEVDDGGEEYDEDTDLEDESEEEEDEDDIENDEEVEEPLSGDNAGLANKATTEAEKQKKVDEDRSNPQYIPKRGTFYEHDDRMADDGGNDVVLQIGDATSGVGIENAGTKGVGSGTKTLTQSPSISHASKTMKKFQQASANERWTHDRFDPSEQQPKSDAEIINQYGFNMRKEAKPPRARRQRRYTRGPNKYDRKWEDESAYIKPPNKERKPPRASDFPDLNERASRKPRRGSREYEDDRVDRRDEKENRPDRRRGTAGGGGSGGVGGGGNVRKSAVNERLNVSAPRGNYGDDRREQRDEGRGRQSQGKSGVQSRLNPSGGSGSGGSNRQGPMEFKQKQRNIRPSTSSSQQQNNSYSQQQQNNGRADERYERQGASQQQRFTQHQSNYVVAATGGNDDHQQYQQQQNRGLRNTSHIATNNTNKPNQTMHGDVYNNNNGGVQGQLPTYGHQHQQHHQQQQHPLSTGLQAQQQSILQQTSLLQTMRQTMPPTTVTTNVKSSAPTPSNLSQRLQQVQNRNDPSHVGSVQMHSLATQNQQQHQHQQQLLMGQQQPNTNSMLMSSAQEQRGPPKRYSSMRRSQHDTNTHQHQQLPPVDAHSHQQHQQLQQLHMPPPPQQQPSMLQDQHSILQANLLQQLYHQENLQAQMQALQVSQPPPQGNAVPPQPKPVYGPNPANAAAYYVADAYGQPQPPSAQAQPPTAAAAAYTTQQQQQGYLPPTPANAAGAALAYPQPPPQAAPNSMPANGPPPPTAVYAAGPPPQNVPAGVSVTAAAAAAGGTANQNFSNFQNYNTVGGTTYFVPPAPTTSRPVVLPQRRPTNAIPILPPAEKHKQRGNDANNSKDGAIPHAQMESGENIDHIIDNMFVQRPAFQQQQPQQQQPPQNVLITSQAASTAPPTDVTSSVAQVDAQQISQFQQPTAASVTNEANLSMSNSSLSNAGVSTPLPEASATSTTSSSSHEAAINPAEITSNNNSVSPQE